MANARRALDAQEVPILAPIFPLCAFVGVLANQEATDCQRSDGLPTKTTD